MGSNISTPVVEGVDNRPILSMGGRMCTWYQSAHPARPCRPIGSVPWLCCYPSAVVVMLERDVAIGLNANRWWHLTLFIQIHRTHCVGKCITPPLKKCFHHCSGITVNVIHPIDQGRTRYLTCVQHCYSVMWRGESRNDCSCWYSPWSVSLVNLKFYWRLMGEMLFFWGGFSLRCRYLGDCIYRNDCWGCCPFSSYRSDAYRILLPECFTKAWRFNLRGIFIFYSRL